jgi:hypothetical protein
MTKSRSTQLLLTTTICVVLTILAGDAARAFVGPIAVGLGRLNEVGEIKTSFSADATLETAEMTVKTRIHYKPGRVRDEMNVGGQKMITIRRFDLGKVWMIIGRGMYMESAVDQDSKQAPDFKLISREILGPETVNGMETTKYKSVYETADGKFGGFTWYTKDNIAVKGFLVHQSKGEKQRVKFEITNLERTEQADSLFEIPKGYQKLDMGGFPGMPNMGGAGSGPSGGFRIPGR